MTARYYDQTIEEVATALKVDLKRGLSANEAARRQAAEGKNELKLRTEPFWRKLLAPFLDIFMAILALALALSLWHGDTTQAILLGAIMLINAIIYYVQSFSTERIVRSLKKQVVDKLRVRRGGRWLEVPSVDLVVGDLVRLGEGEKIAADCRVVAERSVLVDESILTGESERVRKTTRKLAGQLEVYDQRNMLFSGSAVVGGEVAALVVRIGNATQFGQIAALATTNRKHQSPVQQKINRLIRWIAIIVGILSLLLLGLELWRGTSLVASIELVLALAVSAVPEGLPVAITVILALGIKRMAKKRALVTNMRAIETIGAITAIATDKTGTLTENRLTLQDYWSLQNDRHFAKLSQLLGLATLWSSADPLDAAFRANLKLTKAERPRAEPVVVYPFEQRLATSGNLWHDGGAYRLAVKGAPEQILARANLTARQSDDVARVMSAWARQGYRVLALAEAKLPRTTHRLASALEVGKLEFVGLVAVADQIRAESAAAIATARRAGVQVCMVTGDYRETALAIGERVGLHEEEIYARVTPEQKLELLSELEKTHITAMTGDGVNDVPALTQAHVGIAMGDSAPVVKDAGDMILLDNNFTNIVEAMREGRTIVANIRRMLIYLLSTNAGEVLTVFGALLLGIPMPLTPLQILWINLVTDSCLVVPLGLEKPEQNVMRQKPLPLNAALLSRSQVTRVISSSALMALITLGTYLFFAARYNHQVGATLAFQALVVVQWARALSLRSLTQSFWQRRKVKSRPFWLGMLAAVGCQALLLVTPLGAALSFHAVPVWALAAATVLPFGLMLGVVELQKRLDR